MRRPFASAILLLVLLFPAVPSTATTMRHLATRDLVLGSSEIVVGVVEATHPRWSADRRKIFTDVEVRISETLKGAESERVTLIQLGGELDGIKYSVPGGPLFRTGEEALLFVWRDARGQRQVNGLAQGKFEITRDSKSGLATVQRAAPGFAIRDARGLEALRQGEPAPTLPLLDLEREIRRILANPEAGR